MQEIKIALEESGGSIRIINNSNKIIKYFSKNLTCQSTGISYEDPEPNSFSFNSPNGYCIKCKGLGVKSEIDTSKIIPDFNMNIKNGGIKPIGEYKDSWILIRQN